LLMPSLKAQTEFIQRLKKKGVTSVFHYMPLNKSKFALRLLKKTGSTYKNKYNCSVAEIISKKIVRLPFYTSMSKENQKFVIKTIIN